MSTEKIQTAHPNGHFYSPVVDPDEVLSRANQIWPVDPSVLGIDFCDESHDHILRSIFPKYMPDYDYPERSSSHDGELKHFYTQNSQFSWLDSRSTFVLLRHWQPRRIVEVGSGYSSLLMADINRRFLGGQTELICIEPYPRPFLRDPSNGVSRLIEAKVQDVGFDVFERLDAGDILFIDSSHVAKTGSDVNHLYLQVIPRLKKGVRIHVHDILLPNDYLRSWVVDDNRSWNEQYLLQALLMYSNAFEVTFGCSYAFHRFPELVREALNHPKGHAFAGGSFWFEKRI